MLLTLLPGSGLALTATFAVLWLGLMLGGYALTNSWRQLEQSSRQVIVNQLTTLIYIGRQDEVGQ